MFWGLILEPQSRYTQVVKRPFRITMAALDISTSSDEPTQVMVTFQEQNFLMCTLGKDGLLNERLDLCFEAGDKISFAANGNAHVHLTGYLIESDDIDVDGEEEESEEDETETIPAKKRRNEINNAPPAKKSKTLQLLENIQSESDDDSDFSLSKIPMPCSSDDDDDSVEDEDEEVDEEEDEDGIEEEDDGDDDEEEEEDDDDEEEEDSEDEDDEDEDEKPEVQVEVKPQAKATKKQPQDKQAKKDMKNSIPENDKAAKGEKNKKQKKETQQEKTLPQKNGSPGPKKRTIEGGVSVEELRVGNGPVAKPGKFVQVYYEGRLKSNNKLFDSATKGSGFEFRLGRQEVIKGWDVGLAGMKVGGKRRIVCPPNMAYGAKGSPPAIPPNSTLVFDVELKKVK